MMIKDTPLLMTPENAQKCFDGVKTQTRRLNGLHEINESPGKWIASGINGDGDFMFRDGAIPDDWHAWITIKCPYGVVGDYCWIREAWAWPGEEYLMYKSNPADAQLANEWKKDKNYPQVKWIPSIHMPRWACRTVVEVTEVRVERLQDITPDDARAEGCDDEMCSKGAFFELWESIHGPGSWDVNPWVWVLSFQKVEAA